MFQFKIQQEVKRMTYEKAMKELKSLNKKIKILQTQLKNLPEGKLISARNGRHYKWYVSDGRNKTYIPKSDRHFAEKLAYKKYLTLQLTNLEQEKKALEAYLKYHNPNAVQKEIELYNSPAYSELLQTYSKPFPKKIEEWMNASYEKNSRYPEKLIYSTLSGKFVRSKSEVLIDTVLSQNKIPFRYEAALHLENMTIYPDFTILHPKTGELFYWEHFGLIDDPNYSKNAILKLEHYISNGIYPSIQLITTYETKDHPLGMDDIERVVDKHFR